MAGIRGTAAIAGYQKLSARFKAGLYNPEGLRNFFFTRQQSRVSCYQLIEIIHKSVLF
jgi:hypothetical protein